ncbi:hypothetical protein T492DRAFT_879800 [Pavlovales sp. CCMP2436]|nr:hypothetical protein T492DRAFT_879800 [Pavlovales sp. CCMP2436]
MVSLLAPGQPSAPGSSAIVASSDYLARLPPITRVAAARNPHTLARMLPGGARLARSSAPGTPSESIGPAGAGLAVSVSRPATRSGPGPPSASSARAREGDSANVSRASTAAGAGGGRDEGAPPQHSVPLESSSWLAAGGFQGGGFASAQPSWEAEDEGMAVVSVHAELASRQSAPGRPERRSR